MKLYDYFRSSAAYRVRIALNLKGLAPTSARSCICARASSAAQDYLALNPQGLVPALVLDDGRCSRSRSRSSSTSTRRIREPPLLPGDAARRARAFARSRSRSPATSIRSTTCAC